MRRSIALLPLLALLVSCSSADEPDRTQALPSAGSSPRAEASPSPERLSDVDLRAETARALAVAPPPLELRGGPGVGIAAPEPGAPFGGPMGAEAIQEAGAAVVAALDVLFRTPALLRFTEPRTIEEFAGIAALIHPDARAQFDDDLALFLASDANDPAGAPADEATIANLSTLMGLFVRGTDDAGGLDQQEVTSETRLVYGFGGDGAGALGELSVRNLAGLDPTQDTVIISAGVTLGYATLGPAGELYDSALVLSTYQLTMDRSTGPWLIRQWARDQPVFRTVARRP